MLALQWFDQHSKYAPFSDGLSIKKYNDGGELEYIYRIYIEFLKIVGQKRSKMVRYSKLVICNDYDTLAA